MDNRPIEEPNPLASALAHEVRNPLATINLAVQMLKSPTQVPDPELYLDIIMKASGQINDLITDLLKIAQPDQMQLDKYTMHPEKGKLKLITRSINGKCIIEIEDNGIGISKENLQHIFTPYFTDKPGGMGLGLSTTIDILKANHATVDVQSEEAKGTRFILSFEGIQQSGE